MKKRLLTILLFLGALLPLAAQTFDYNNTWYKNAPNQTYVKLVVDEDGLYRVSAQDLTTAGYNLAGVDPRNVRLYYRGKEVSIYVSRIANAIEYIEFFGRRNDGRVDSIMYRLPQQGVHAPNLQPNINLSLFSDESAYFLTWGTTPSGSRFFTSFDPTYSLYTPEPHFRYKALREYKANDPATTYVRGGGGTFDAFYTLNSDYVTGEGYNGPDFAYNEPRTVALSTPFPANSGNPHKVEARVFGRSNTPHTLRLLLNGNAAQPVMDTAISINSVYIRTFVREYSATLTGTTDLTYQALKSPTDNNHICLSALTYDRLPNLGGDSSVWVREWNKTGKSYLRLDNVRGNDTVYVYDFVNRMRHKGLITTSGTSKVANVVLQGFNNTRDLFVATDAGIKKPRIVAHKLNRLFDANGGAEYVIIANRGLQASAEAYANYRDTATISPIASVKVVYTDEIYDEFGGGTVTPWAVKRFCKYALDNWQTEPRYFLLWGKGVYETRINEDTTYVPTFGYPATDYEYVGHFDQNAYTINPEAAIGRVNLFDDSEGFAYLNKINEYEHTPWSGWMKEGVFLGGGGTLAEQSSISGAFDYMIGQFKDMPFGGKDHYFQKNSASVVIDPTTATYHDQINEGVSVIHFFGHSTSNILDISIRQPFEYNNFHRYPFMIAMGCYGGDFTSGESFGEQWVKQPERGSIGYLANSSAGYLIPLRDYGQTLYNYLYGSNLGEPIGDILKLCLSRYTDSLAGIQYRNHGRQLNLQGDPALKLYHPQYPDLEINASSIYFDPATFTAQDDSFRIHIIVTNQGLVTADSFRITVRQRLPDGSVVDHPYRDFAMVRYRDTLSWVLRNTIGNGITGLNYFDIMVDARDSVYESDESNNFVSLNKVVPGNIPAILYPLEYAVVGEDRIRLEASAFFMTRDQNIGYIFEIDSTDLFNSPLYVSSGVITGKATFVDWEVPFTLQDSGVYYWRVRLADATPVTWANASFRYINNRQGWAQARFPQFSRDQTDGIVMNRPQEEMQFEQFGAEYEFVARKGGDFAYSVNGSLVGDAGLNGFTQDGVAFAIIDQYTLTPITRVYFYEFVGVAPVPQGLHLLRDAILSAKTGDYIVVANNRNPRVPTWPEETFEALELIGVSENIRLLQDGDAFLILGRKGYPNAATEIYAPNYDPKFVITSLLLSYYNEGKLNSTRIGPALKWDKLFWGWRSKDAIVRENTTVSVYGEQQDGSDTLLIPDLNAGTYSLSAIDPAEYPYLRLKSFLQDTVTRTAPQLDNWHVLYTPAPDAVVDPITNFEFRSDTIYEGQDIFIHMAARNISPTPMDSVKVRFRLERADRSFLVLDSLKIAPLLPGAAPVEFEYQFDTRNKNLEGDVVLVVELNPNFEQVEQHTFNNIFVKSFFVKVDRANPLLDVTFDGKRIIDGDIVSPRPEILVEVNDENPLIALDDSSTFELYFKEGTSAATDFERIFITSDARVDWRPATLPDNKARLYFYPGKQQALADGEYTLRVQGRDKKGNAAGNGENFYEIRFEVENASSITHVFNYPNPFSSSTRFVYTLTGAEVPELFQIHIYTISGKLVKVVDLGELGDVHIGRNLTDYAWDGTDEYGDRLANGVYLYRIVTRMQSNVGEMELRDEGTSQYFNNGWGKMYILR